MTEIAGAEAKRSERRPSLHVYDGSPIELRGRLSQMRMASLARDWEIVGHTSRNALLEALASGARSRPRKESVALIDARVESGDIDQVGFRICETIQRHGHLWKATRPLVWVDKLTEANCLYAQRVGAAAIVDDDWVDRTDAGELGAALEATLSEPPRPLGAKRSFQIVSDRRVDREAEAAERDALFKGRFGHDPGKVSFELLWGMADAVELSFLYWYCAEQGWATERQAKRACERLQEAMRPEREHLDRPEPTNAEIARRFLAEVSPAAPDPLAEIAWPGVEYSQANFADPELRRLAYLEAGSDRLLERFFAIYEPVGGATRERYEAIRDACQRVAAASDLTVAAARNKIQRTFQALDDARLDAVG